jgi:hypothetical protein
VSGDVWDFEANPLAVRETFERSLSLGDLLRRGAAVERPREQRQQQR